MICEYCQQTIRKDRLVCHVNVSRKVPTRKFCSKACKRKWEQKVRNAPEVTVRAWKVGRVMGTLTFLPATASGADFPEPIATKYPSTTHFFSSFCPLDEEEVLKHLIAESL